jgi:hypothetical protein
VTTKRSIRETPERQQIGVRLSAEAVAHLATLQTHYAQRGGLIAPVSQSQTVEIVLRETVASLQDILTISKGKGKK